MDKKPYITRSHDVHLDNEYNQWLTELIGRYRKAAVKVNSEKLLWNWLTGRDIVRRKAEEKWGSGIVEQLSLDLQAAFPGETGFSSRNLWYMKKWYLFYSSELNRLLDDTTLRGKVFLHQAGAEIQAANSEKDIILHQAGAEFVGLSDNEQIPTIFTLIPWKHHVEIISKCESIEEAVFYIKLTVAESLSKQGLMNCIKANLFVTRGGAVTNFKDKLQLPQAQLAQEITRGNFAH